jgi:hypothetical protein
VSYIEGTSVTLTATVGASSIFTGWTGCDTALETTCTVNMNTGRTVSATFQPAPIYYSLAVIKVGAGSGSIISSLPGIDCGTTCSAIYLAGSSVTLTATVDAGSTFAGWTGCDSVADTTCMVTMAGSRAVTATFTTTTGLRFLSTTPCRVADTRQSSGPFGGPAIPGGSFREFLIPSSACGIPSTAAAYALNVTVVPHGPLEYLTVWPSGRAMSNVSLLNSRDGRVKANAAIMAAGVAGAVSVFATHTADVVLDISGYFVPATDTSALAFYPLAPCRVADTRNANGALGGPYLAAGQTRTFPVLSSSCQLPASAQAYALNLTAVPHGALGYLSAWPTGQPWPVVSTLNAPTGTVTANAAIVPAGSSGAINLLASHDTDVVIDVNGYFAPAGTGGLSLYTVTPCRGLDTRNTTGAFSGTMAFDATATACSVLASAEALVLNATVIPTAGLHYLTLWPSGQAMPGVSTLNAEDGALTSNMAIVPTTSGSIDAYTTNSTQLLLDINGYFAGGTAPTFAYQVNPVCDYNLPGCISLYHIEAGMAMLSTLQSRLYP